MKTPLSLPGLLLLLLLWLAAGAAPSARAQIPGGADQEFHHFNFPGNVYVLAVQADDKILVGGDYRIPLTRLNADGSLDTAFSPTVTALMAFDLSGTLVNTSSVTALAVQPDGRILIAGYFNLVNGVTRYNVARLNPDGTLDTSFDAGAGPDGATRAMAMQLDGKIIIAGSFPTLNGAARPDVARLNADGSVDAGFNPGTGPQYNSGGTGTDPGGGGVIIINPGPSPPAAYVVGAAVQPDGKILIAGTFNSYDGAACNGIARLNADGSFDPGFASPDTDYEVGSMALQPDGKVVCIRCFPFANSSPPPNVVERFNADGTPDISFTDVAEPYFSASCLLPQSDGKLVVGGFNVVAPMLVRFNADGSLDATFTAGANPQSSVATLAAQGNGEILAVGYWPTYTGLGRLYSSTNVHLSFYHGEVPLGNGAYYLQFTATGNPFGYYSYLTDPRYIYHDDLGYEYVFDAGDESNGTFLDGVYLYDFQSGGYFYTSPVFPFPYLYDFSLNSVVYYYPDPRNAGRYNTDGVRYFYVFDTGQIISK